MMMSARMDYTTVAYMQIVQIQMEVLSVLAIMDFLETGRLALVSEQCHAPVLQALIQKFGMEGGSWGGYP